MPDKVTGYEADSWGTEFIFVVPPNNGDAANTKAVLEISAMIRGKLVNVLIEYNEVTGKDSNDTLTRKVEKLLVKEHTEVRHLNQFFFRIYFF
ncbi:unnamed protein product [Gongylonema pulchrum]|uniref:Uncharacterized protein n=1 Tax=Gongylonema pulchrum TaxID=637853 RepID=A0A3P6QKJ9_9BILA|nr:unnamed protein product [Gongylonema pulchrum]